MGSKYPDDWDDRRSRVYRRDNYRCQSCGDGGGSKGDAELHAHHKIPISEGGEHNLGNLKTLCSECHENEHDHPIFAGGNDSGTDSGWNLFSLGIHNLGNSIENTTPTKNSGYTHSNVDDKLDTIGEIISVGIFLTVATFVFTSMFWIALFDGEGLLSSIGILAIFLIILGIPLFYISIIAGLIPTVVIIVFDDVLLSKLGWGRNLNDVEKKFYLMASLSFVILFNLFLLQVESDEATLANSLWPATQFAILGGITIFILTKIFLWRVFLLDSDDDK